jgi:hypothetical protein
MTVNQEIKTAVASYDGFEYDMYSFSISSDDDESNAVISFSKIPEEILLNFDLKSDKLVGRNFEISYEVSTTYDEDLDEEEEIYVLKSLKKVKR